MRETKVDWISTAAVNCSAVIERFVAIVGHDKLEICVCPWGEGNLTLNGIEIAYIHGRNGSREAIIDLKKIAEQYMAEQVRICSASSLGTP
jgi:hypothetical protein